jgi:hypothetical protein
MVGRRFDTEARSNGSSYVSAWIYPYRNDFNLTLLEAAYFPSHRQRASQDRRAFPLLIQRNPFFKVGLNIGVVTNVA